MKFTGLLFSILLVLSTTGCSDSSSSDTPDTIEFTGVFSRQFEAAGHLHTATYTVNDDIIQYQLTGNIGNANYKILRDHYTKDDQRFIGHTESGTYYLIFFKNITESSITLYKQEVSSIKEAQELDIPPSDTTENHGWNTYTN